MCEDIMFSRKAHLVCHWCLYNKGPYFMLVTLSTTDKHETDSVLIIFPPPPPPPLPLPLPPSVLLLRVFKGT